MADMKSSLKSYDDAVESYFKQLFSNTVYAPTDKAMQKNAEKNGDKAKLPMLSVWRTPNIQLTGQMNFAQFKRGHTVKVNDVDMKITKMRLLPVQLEYQVDVWADDLEVGGGLFSELLFYIHDNPALHVPVSFMDEPLGLAMHIGEVSDLTDITQESETGREFRTSVLFNLDAFIFKAELNPMAKTITYSVEEAPPSETP